MTVRDLLKGTLAGLPVADGGGGDHLAIRTRPWVALAMLLQAGWTVEPQPENLSIAGFYSGWPDRSYGTDWLRLKKEGRARTIGRVTFPHIRSPAAYTDMLIQPDGSPFVVFIEAVL